MEFNLQLIKLRGQPIMICDITLRFNEQISISQTYKDFARSVRVVINTHNLHVRNQQSFDNVASDEAGTSGSDHLVKVAS